MYQNSTRFRPHTTRPFCFGKRTQHTGFALRDEPHDKRSSRHIMHRCPVWLYYMEPGLEYSDAVQLATLKQGPPSWEAPLLWLSCRHLRGRRIDFCFLLYFQETNLTFFPVGRLRIIQQKNRPPFLPCRTFPTRTRREK